MRGWFQRSMAEVRRELKPLGLVPITLGDLAAALADATGSIHEDDTLTKPPQEEFDEAFFALLDGLPACEAAHWAAWRLLKSSMAIRLAPK